jgi:hypothetical protein
MSLSAPDAAIDALMPSYDPALAVIVAELRLIFRGLPGASEGLKWASPSYRTAGDWFATFNKTRDRLPARIILHRGAAKRERPIEAGDVADPEGLLRWLGPDRAAITVDSLASLQTRRAAIEALVVDWLRWV